MHFIQLLKNPIFVCFDLITKIADIIDTVVVVVVVVVVGRTRDTGLQINKAYKRTVHGIIVITVNLRIARVQIISTRNTKYLIYDIKYAYVHAY